MTTNPDRLPERIIAFRPKRSATVLPSGPTFAAEEQRPGDRPTCAEEQAYVREDVAAEQAAAALRGEAHETTALRRERDALAARLFAEERRVAALREGLRVIVMRSLASVDDPSVDVMAYEIADHALMLDSDMMADGDEDEAAAGKGVG